MEGKSRARDVRMRIFAFIAIATLSVDEINPVKVVCSILGINSVYVAWISIVAACAVFYANSDEMAYFLTKVFLKSIMGTFFSSIEVLGHQNIPAHGPIIFTGNHMNQFVDAALILVTCPQKVGFLIAEKSFHKRIIGDLARAVGSIPVTRPQDHAKKGPGRIYFDGVRLIGEGTEFTKLMKGDKIRPGRSAECYRVKNITSDTEAEIANDPGESSILVETYGQGVENWTNYDILAFVDQGKVFDAVHEALSRGKNLGIFPEGGSHDNTDLLPLKAGVSAITFGALDKYDITVPIVPVGLNYFRGHRFRGRVVVEYGEPIFLNKSMIQLYRESKRAGYQALLTEVEDGMRSVIVTAPNYEELKLIHTLRRLYQRGSASLTTKERQDLARRFSAGYRIIKERYGNNIPEDLLELMKRLEEYQNSLDYWGLKDYQVMNNLEVSFSRLLYVFFHGVIVIALASIPSLILNAPVGFAARYWSFKEAQKDLKASRVKLAARDVLLSKKILFSLVAVPALWLFYAILLWLFTPLQKRTIVVLLLCCPIFSYLGVTAVEAGMVDVKDLRPAFLRLLPSYRKVAVELPEMRLDLHREVRRIVKKYGPELGSVYTDRSSNWEQSLRRTSSMAKLSDATSSDATTPLKTNKVE